ncbi:hypothetical protein ABPG74_000568 [Tetrahymena malaccensis]
MRNISYIKNPDNLNLGQCLSSLTQLKVLKLDFHLIFPSQFQECFQMLEAYQKLKMLKSLQIQLRYLPNNYSTVYEIVEGISNLQSLEELVIHLGMNACANSGFDKLIEEITYLVNLKILKLKLMDHLYLGRNANRFSQVIKNLQQLEEITLQLPNYILKQNNFIKELESLSNLKKINYKSQNLNYETAWQQLQQITRLKNLDQTKLNIIISNESMNIGCLQIIQENLLNASNLTKLSLSFPPNSSIYLFELMSFLICLQNCQKLEKIDIKFPLANLEEFYKEDPNQDFQIPHSYLKKLKLSITSTRNKKDYGRVNKMLSLFKSQTQLESFFIYISDLKYANDLGQLDLGDILSEMDNLKTLILKIGQQYFVQEDQIQKFFEDLKRKQKLEKLIIRIMKQNQFSNMYLKQLGDSLSYLKNLKELDLQIAGNSSDFDSQGILQFSQGFGQLQQLKILSLTFTYITLSFPSIYPLLQQIKELKQLRQLSIQFRGLDKSDGTYQENLTEIIFPQQLKSIDISLKQGSTEFKCIKGIFEGVQNLLNLNNLTIQIKLNQIELEEIKYIENKLANLTALQTLELNFAQSSLLYLLNMIKKCYQLNNITFLNQNLWQYCIQAMRSVQENLENFDNNQQKLIQRGGLMQLSYTYFKQFNKQDDEIFKEIFSNNDIRSFDFVYAKDEVFGDEQAFYLFSNISLLVNLKVLKLKFRQQIQFSQISFNLIAQTLSTLKNLEALDIQFKKHNEYYDFVDLKPIFTQISSLQQLKKLCFKFSDLQSNEEVLKIMFEAISNLKNLSSLKLKMFESFMLENTQNLISQMFQSLKSLKKIDFIVNLNQQDQIRSKVFFQSFKYLQKVNQIKTLLQLSSQKRILMKIPKLVVIKEINN